MIGRYISLRTSPWFHLHAFLTTTLFVVPFMLYLAPASWMFTAKVFVPDFPQGANPVLDYTRSIRVTQYLDWQVEIRPVGRLFGQFCQGYGRNLYSEREPSSFPIRLRRYTGDEKCDLLPGSYIMETCWTGKIVWFPKTFCTESNVFRVYKQDE